MGIEDRKGELWDVDATSAAFAICAICFELLPHDKFHFLGTAIDLIMEPNRTEN